MTMPMWIHALNDYACALIDISTPQRRRRTYVQLARELDAIHLIGITHSRTLHAWTRTRLPLHRKVALIRAHICPQDARTAHIRAYTLDDLTILAALHSANGMIIAPGPHRQIRFSLAGFWICDACGARGFEDEAPTDYPCVR